MQGVLLIFLTFPSSLEAGSNWYPFDAVYDTLYTSTLFSICEIVHAWFGLTDRKRTLRASITRVGMSNFIVFAVFAPSTEVQHGAFVFWLLLVWSVQEVIVIVVLIIFWEIISGFLIAFGLIKTPHRIGVPFGPIVADH